MAYEFITGDREGPVTIFTLNRPEVMNALHSPMHFELDEAFNAFAADPEQWVGIVTGAGAPIPEGKEIPDNSLVMGAPGKVIREVGDQQALVLKASALHYVENWKRFRRDLVQR